MALINCQFFSETLGLSCTMNVILPPQSGVASAGRSKTRAASRPAYPVLYLLHGMSDDHSTWVRRTSLERYAAAYPLAIVMPAAARSYYTDMVSGPRYWTFISDELPRLVSAFFPVSTKREDTFVAGLSMGGYGAFKLALRHPETFAAAGSFSGALTLAWTRSAKERQAESRGIFGDRLKATDDLLRLASKLAGTPAPRPRLYQSCGTEDFLYAENLQFKRHAERLGYQLTYSQRPGAHEWGFWDKEIESFLAWLPLRPQRLRRTHQRSPA